MMKDDLQGFCVVGVYGRPFPDMLLHLVKRLRTLGHDTLLVNLCGNAALDRTFMINNCRQDVALEYKDTLFVTGMLARLMNTEDIKGICREHGIHTVIMNCGLDEGYTVQPDVCVLCTDEGAEMLDASENMNLHGAKRGHLVICDYVGYAGARGRIAGLAERMRKECGSIRIHRLRLSVKNRRLSLVCMQNESFKGNRLSGPYKRLLTVLAEDIERRVQKG